MSLNPLPVSTARFTRPDLAQAKVDGMRNSPNLDKFRAGHSEALLSVFLCKADEAGREITVWRSPYILIGRAYGGDIIGPQLSAI